MWYMLIITFLIIKKLKKKFFEKIENNDFLILP